MGTWTLCLLRASRAMIATPCFRGSRSVRSWLPPSGKMPRHFPSRRALWTASYISDWSTFGKTLYVSPPSALAFTAQANCNSVSEITAVTLYGSSWPLMLTCAPGSTCAVKRVPSPLSEAVPSESTRPSPEKAMSCGRLTGMALNALARCPTTGLSQDFLAIMKLISLWQVVRRKTASTNWLLWVPVKITGPCEGMFSAPTISTERKNMLLNVHRKNSRQE
mmetsp:Transcript_59804/g.155328  ORF Transcript_59804/g.155328 Transcript_59804/m.155328 type:complete len:221 (-) Transcript_59804:267-929(-)